MLVISVPFTWKNKKACQMVPRCPGTIESLEPGMAEMTADPELFKDRVPVFTPLTDEEFVTNISGDGSTAVLPVLFSSRMVDEASW